ncbi:MAG TPA: hypothetical protein C5S37_14220, partial [Methanophagales archaeon]|nr:hypothetical protein [Methanophagales archaeon]
KSKSDIRIGIATVVIAIAMLAMVPGASAWAYGSVGNATFENGTYVGDGWQGKMENLDQEYGTEPWPFTTQEPYIFWDWSCAGQYEQLTDRIHVNITSPDGKWYGETTKTMTEAHYPPLDLYVFDVVVHEEEPPCKPGIEVNKTVWDGTAWVELIPDAEICETYRFRCEIHNNGTCCNLTNIAVTDTLSDSLEYANNATVDGVPREPDWIAGNKFGWDFTGPLAPCETIIIEFDAHVIDYGHDCNVQNATAFCEETGEWVSDEDDACINVPAPKPDLIVTAINAYHNNTGCPAWFNLSNEIDVIVKNIGNANATETFNVCVSIEDVPFDGKLSVSQLNISESKTVTFENWKPIGDDCLQPPCELELLAKYYNFTAVADCDNDVDESDETNNETTVVDKACYNGYMADEPLENVAHGKLHGHMIYTTGDGAYTGLYSVGDTQVTNYDITIPAGASVKVANLNVYYTWTKPQGTCPEMEVSIKKNGGTPQVLSLEKAYNDVKCTCPGASWILTWGNYVYDLTDYIDGSGTYTVTVKNVCVNCSYFCPAAPGIVLVYEDANAPMMEYWINKGADVLMGGRRYSTSSNLAWWECINNATFQASTQTEEVVSATLGVVAPWGDDVPNDILFFNDIELGRGVYHGYSSLYNETIDSLSMYVGASGNAQVGANVTDVTALYLNNSDNVVGQADDGDNIMACNAFLVVTYKAPDLVITNKSETLEDGTFTVTYTVANVGDGDAGASNTTIFIDGVPKKEDPVPALAAGASHTATVGPFDCPCGTTLNVTVCADNENVVEECNETNNCLENELVCPGIPDLVVEKSVTFDEDGNFIVSYTVTNQGCGPAGESTTCKFVDGELKESQTCPALGSGESYSGTFEPEPCPCNETLNVTVCADNENVVAESDETNNCEVNFVECPPCAAIVGCGDSVLFKRNVRMAWRALGEPDNRGAVMFRNAKIAIELNETIPECEKVSVWVRRVAVRPPTFDVGVSSDGKKWTPIGSATCYSWRWQRFDFTGDWDNVRYIGIKKPGDRWRPKLMGLDAVCAE